MNRKVIITKTAEKKLEKLFDYLLENWNLKIKNDFIEKLDENINIIKSHPLSFPESQIKKGLHKRVITKQTSLFYRHNSKRIVLVTIFDNRMNPNKLLKQNM